MRILLRWLVAAGALWLTLWLLHSFYPAGIKWSTEHNVVLLLITTVALGFANAFIGPLVKFLTLPLNCLTFGLFSFVINAALFWGAGELTGAYQVDFVAALIGSILMAVINGLASHLIGDEREWPCRRARRELDWTTWRR